jgi:hypothetical protein
LIIWLIFFLFLQTKPCFCRLFAWSQLDFSANPVFISAVSSRRLTTYLLLDFKVSNGQFPSDTLFKSLSSNMFISRIMIQILHNIQNVQAGKRHHKKGQNFQALSLFGTNLSTPFVFVFSAFGEKFPTAGFRIILAETPCCEIERKWPNF